MATVTFNQPFATTPKAVQVTPASYLGALQTWSYYVTSLTTTGYELATGTAPNASAQHDYFVVVVG